MEKVLIDEGKNNFFNSVLGNYIASIRLNLVDEQLELWPYLEKQNSLFIFLKNSLFIQAWHLSDFSSQDFFSFKKRFNLFYQLTSLMQCFSLKIFCQIDELTVLPTLQKIYPAIGWLEREVWDFFGIYFSNHSNLWRILNDYGFLGYPLRKDFPLTGFLEVFYDDFKARLVKVPVELTQEYRKHTYLSVWKKLNDI